MTKTKIKEEEDQKMIMMEDLINASCVERAICHTLHFILILKINTVQAKTAQEEVEDGPKKIMVIQ